MENYIRFDWAMKRLLRQRDNYAVLEGLLTILLNMQVRILLIIDSTPYKDDDIPERFRMNLLIANEKDECALVEIQNNNEYAYYQRVIFGLSSQLTDFVNRYKDGYGPIGKVYSVNIVYFPLVHGKDFVYHGKTVLHGIHTDELLDLSPFQQQVFEADETHCLYPEYYILKVCDFNKIPQSPLEEWMYYLNTGNVPDKVTAPGLDMVKKQLRLEQLKQEDVKAYHRHLNDLAILRDNLYAEHTEGYIEGVLRTARNLKKMGMDVAFIAQVTGLLTDEIDAL